MKVSFEEIGAMTATFYAQEGVEGGQVVQVTGDGTVGACAAGDRFCGAALAVAGDHMAAVQVGGFCTLKAGSGVAPGWAGLTADGAGGVRPAAEGETGRECLVVSVDAAAGTAVVLL